MTGLAALNRLALDLLFPRRCVGCQKEGLWICSACSDSLVVQGEERQVADRSVTWLFDFDTPLVREILHNLKYNGVRELAEELGRVVSGLRLPGISQAVLIPVPLSKARLKTRGYNQAEELALVLGRLFDIPVWNGCLKREGSTRTQVGRDAQERQLVQKGFAWTGSVPEAYAGRRWIVVDDLITTGSTLAACFEALRPHAVSGLSGLTVASKR